MRYIVAYAKIVDSKEDGIVLNGVYYGGMGETLEEAEALAKECINNSKSGVAIIPKVMPLESSNCVVTALYNASDAFEKMTNQMIDAKSTIDRSQSIKKRKKK